MTPEWLEKIEKRAKFLEHQEYQAKETVIEAEIQLIADGYYEPIATLYAHSQVDIPALLSHIHKLRDALDCVKKGIPTLEMLDAATREAQVYQECHHLLAVEIPELVDEALLHNPTNGGG